MLKDQGLHDDKLLIRLSSVLTDAVDQVLREQMPYMNRSEFFRRSARFALDNLEMFKGSDASTVIENQEVQSVAKVNAVRDLHDQLFQYKELLQKEPLTPTSIKQLSFLIYMVGEMIYKMNDIIIR